MKLGVKAAWVGLAWALMAPVAGAQMRAELAVEPQVLRVGEAASLALIIRGVNDPRPPALTDVEGFQIQYHGAQSQVSFVNGRVDRFTTFQFSALAMKPGVHTIGPFVYEHAGQKATVAAVRVEVVEEGGPPAGNAITDRLFARIEASKQTVYLHEPFEITIALYARDVDLADQINLDGMPKSGLAIGQFREFGAVRETLDGRIYTVRRFRAPARALSAGTFTLEPSLTVQVVVQTRGRARDPLGDDIFEEFMRNFGGMGQTRAFAVEVKPFELTARDLPARGRPASFSGAVGRFTFEVQVRPSELAVGEPATVHTRIAGAGYLGGITAPAIPESAALHVYEPRAAAAPETERRFEQVVIPRTAAAKEIPALEFSYFDPESGVYETLRRGPFPLTLHAAAAGDARLVQAPGANGSPASPDALVRGADLVYLKPAPARWIRTAAGAAGGAPGWGAAAAWLAPALLLGAVALVARRRDRLATDTAFARRERAPRVARTALEAARRALTSGSSGAFFEALWEALSRYFGLKLGLPPGAVTTEAVLGAAQRAGVDAAGLEALRTVLTRCEAARFGGATADPAALRGMLDTVHRVLRTCERGL